MASRVTRGSLLLTGVLSGSCVRFKVLLASFCHPTSRSILSLQRSLLCPLKITRPHAAPGFLLCVDNKTTETYKDALSLYLWDLTAQKKTNTLLTLCSDSYCCYSAPGAAKTRTSSCKFGLHALTVCKLHHVGYFPLLMTTTWMKNRMPQI